MRPLIRSGLLAVYKPPGVSSSNVVERIFRLICDTSLPTTKRRREHMKVGHGGTLDPIAEGVLVLGIQKGTKLLSTYLQGGKKYSTIGVLGTATDTLDLAGKVIETCEWRHVTLDLMESKLPKFTGNIMQIPPMYSALKKDGQPLYRIARNGGTVEREPRQVYVRSIVLDRLKELPYFDLHIECGGGCYVRSIVADLAKECDTVGHVSSLVRVQQGPFHLSDCLTSDKWNLENIIDGIQRCNEIAGIHFPEDQVYERKYSRFQKGNERMYSRR
jgi:tRNA pseudouridine55 synthase